MCSQNRVGLTRIVALIVPLLIAHATSFAQYPIGVEYKKRENRYEGVKSSPVSGYYIELISALIVPQQSSEAMPEALNLRFYLHQPSSVFITVRERDPVHNYWLDEVTPKRPWRTGFDNEFSWPSKDVLRRLKPQLKFSDLAVIVRLGRRTASLSETVAPTIFYSSQLPSTVNGYAFSFRMNVDARLSCSIYRDEGNSQVYSQNFTRLHSGRPFTFMWNTSNAPEGWYKLIVKGKKLSNNEDVDLSVRFYHRPLIKR